MRTRIAFGLAQLLILCLFSLPAPGSEPFPEFPDSPPEPLGPSCSIYRAEPVYDLGPRKIKILVTNDVHGRVFEDADKAQIGYPLLKSRIEAAEREGYEVFLMDAGDAVSGNAVAQFDNGRSVSGLMGKMGYRVVCPGNHAFDFNETEGDPLYYSNVLLKQMRSHAENGFNAVCLNLTYNGHDVPGISRDPVVLVNEAGFRLVVVGILTPYTRKNYNLKSLNGYDFGLIGSPDDPDHAATKEHIIDLLTYALTDYDRPGDIVVVLSHVGRDDTEDYNQGQLNGADLAGVPNVDFVVDAHSHNLVPAEKIGSAHYGIANRYLDHVAELTVISEDGSISTHMEIRDYQDLKEHPPQEKVLTMLREISDRLGMDEQLFQLPAPALTDNDVSQESVAIGRLLCKGMVDLTGADLAVINAGNIRSSLMPGWITAGDIYDVTPYQNNIVAFDMTGREIRQVFDSMQPRRTNGFPQLYGMTVFTWDDGEPVLKVAGILDKNGQPLEADRMYRVALNDFIAYGGDRYVFNTSRPYKNYGDMVTGLILYFRNRGVEAVRAVQENNAMPVYPTRGEAEDAYAGAEAEKKAIN